MVSGKVKILLVEDDTNLGFLLVEFLEMNGFDVKLYRNGKSGYQGYKNGEFDFCILDVMLPVMNGLTLAKKIRAENSGIPILFLTVKSQKTDLIKGFHAGGDDYVVKPFDEEELLCRIRAIIARTNNAKLESTRSIFSIGMFTFDYPNRSLSGSGCLRRLTQKENEVLRLLCVSKNRLIHRTEILQSIWGTVDYFSGRSLDVYISKLRKYLAGDSGISIESITGAGYILSD